VSNLHFLCREEAQVKAGKADNTKAQMKKKISETKKRIKQIVEDTGNCDQEILELQSAQKVITDQLKEQQQQNRDLITMVQSLETELEQLDSTKHKVFSPTTCVSVITQMLFRILQIYTTNRTKSNTTMQSRKVNTP